MNHGTVLRNIPWSATIAALLSTGGMFALLLASKAPDLPGSKSIDGVRVACKAVDCAAMLEGR